MSKEQPKSSKKAKSDKIGVKKKVRDYVSKQNVKISRTSSKVKSQISSFYSDKIIHQEVYVDGQEPESYSFKKKFYALYGIFIVYSLILIVAINIPGEWINYLTFGNPFAFSNTLVAFFLVLSILFSIDKLRIFIFEKRTALKQLILFCALIVGLYILFLYFSTDLNFTTYLLALGMIWLVLLSSRFYIYSRKFSTKIEARFIKKYSIPRYLVAIIIPFIILGILVFISLFYRSLLVFLSLDFFGNPIFGDPSSAVDVYKLEMRIIMPLIYFSLVLTLVFIIFEFVFTRRRAETKRAGTFDNFTFSLIVLFIFFFQILQISIYMLLRPETVTALKATIGATGSAVSYIFIFEFVVSMYFLFRIVRKTGRTLGWRILFFKKDGLIMLFLACVFAQTLTRFSLANEIPNQIISDVGVWLMADKYIISILMIFFLGCTILIYYLKPHETSMFMRLQKETVIKEEKNFEKIYKILRSEYIRRGEAYPIEIIERELIKATQLSKGNMYSLLEQLVEKDMDIIIREKKEKLAKPTKMIDFVSVTERFEKKGVAEQKAKRYLSERLLETALEKDRKTSRLKTSEEAGKATNSFISSLTEDFSKKQRDKQIFTQRLKEKDISFTPGELTGDLKNQIIQIIKKEYIYRVENPEKIPDFYIPISEISNEIEIATKITPGELYPLLDELNKKDIEVLLMTNPDEPEDKKIKFLPYADDNMSYSLANFRPEEYSKFRILVMKNFLKNLRTKREKRILFQLKKEIPDLTEAQNSWIYLLTTLHKYYPLFTEQLEKIPDKKELLKNLDSIIKVFEKKQTIIREN
ncbi:MAG: hypothetical protein ACXAEX_20005 [Promethearchaeota archaeon]|jgi:hypothetical protein